MPRKSGLPADELAKFIGKTVEVRTDLPSVIGPGVRAGERGVVLGVVDWFDLLVDFPYTVRAVMLDEIKVVGNE